MMRRGLDAAARRAEALRIVIEELDALRVAVIARYAPAAAAERLSGDIRALDALAVELRALRAGPGLTDG